MAVEDQGSGTQYVRFRVWPTIRPVGIASLGLFGALTGAAGLDAAWIMCTALSAGLMWLLLCTWQSGLRNGACEPLNRNGRKQTNVLAL